MTALAEGEVARGTRIVLREKRLSDAPDDYRWRRDPELSRFDAVRPLTVAYQEYLAHYREDLLYPGPYRRALAIEDMAGLHFGNVMYYNIDMLRQEAEVGITIGDRRFWDAGYGTEVVRLLVDYLVGRLAFHRVHLKTLDWNTRAMRCFEKAGFVRSGETERGGKQFVLMEVLNESGTAGAGKS